MSDLLPCPFCGGEARYYHRPDTTGWSNTEWVACVGDCGASTCMHETKEEAIAAWNTRNDDLVQAAVAAALREAAAAALREAAKEIEEGMLLYAGDGGSVQMEVAEHILDLITPDAQAALNRMVAAKLREADKAIQSVAANCTTEDGHVAIIAAVEKMRSLIPKGESDA